MSETKTNRRTTGVIIFSVLAALSAGGTVWWRYAHPAFGKYDAALAAIKARHVTFNEAGDIDLSRDFPGLCAQDQAFVTYLPDGNVRVMFPTDRGEGPTVRGLMYTSRRLTEDDTVSRVGAIHFDQRVIRAGSYAHLVLDKRLNDHWYEVSFQFH